MAEPEVANVNKGCISGCCIPLCESVTSWIMETGTTRKLFDECILGHLDGVTRVLVTNRLDLVPRCDRVVLVEADAHGVGRVTQSGDHDSLLGQGGAYAALLAESSVSQLSASEQDGKRATKQATKRQATEAAEKGGARIRDLESRAENLSFEMSRRDDELNSMREALEEALRTASTASDLEERLRRGEEMAGIQLEDMERQRDEAVEARAAAEAAKSSFTLWWW